jgi:putative SOS response-associated peptidase YedK
MCGRFTLTQSPEAIAQAFQLKTVPVPQPRYNIAPTQPILAIRPAADTGERELTYLHWGLIPSWSKDPSIGSRLINARAETLTEKPSFRTAFKRRRCLIVADGFYEWQRLERGKQPFYFCLENHQPFAFAGLWEHWDSAEGEIQSGTLITTEADNTMRPVHDRMPVIVSPEDYDLWLAPQIQTVDRLQQILYRELPAEMIYYPVRSQVNSPENDQPACVQPLASGQAAP